MLNQVVLVGRLTSDLEAKETESGKKVVSLTLAVPRSYKNMDGEYDTDFLDVVLWDTIAENTVEYCRKGDMVGIKGRLQASTYETEDGSKRKVTEVVAAVIIKDGNILATQRGYGEFKGKWEFPGGKVEENENLEHAIQREIKEETNADINVLEYINTIEYDYATFHLTMHCYLCELINDISFVYHDDNSLEHENMIWLDLNDLDHLDWLPADVLVLDKIKEVVPKYITI